MRQDEELGKGKLSVRGMEPTREHIEVLRETRQKGRKDKRDKRDICSSQKRKGQKTIEKGETKTKTEKT